MFNYDWWFGSAHAELIEEAKRRCADARFSGRQPSRGPDHADYKRFHERLESRTVLYLRDGFSYEVKSAVQRANTTTFTFECMPADEAYRVGSFVVTVPFDDIVRVEVFAVHPDEKPEDMPSIKGFTGIQGPPGRRQDDRTTRHRDDAGE